MVVSVIVFRHTFAAEPGEKQLLIATVSVPFFFFLTGWLWRPGARSLREEVANRTRSLLIPYVSWFALILVLYVVTYRAQGQLSVKMIVDALLGGSYAKSPFTTFWFITALFLVAMAMRCLDRASKPVIAVAAALSLSATVLGESLAQVPWSVGIALPCLFFAIAGHLLHDLAPSRSGTRTVLAGGLVPVAVVASFHLSWLDIKPGTFGTPVASVVCVVAFTWGAFVLLDAALAAMPRVSTAIAPTLDSLARVSITVVLMHPVLIWATGHSFDPNVGTFVISLLGSWALAVGLSRTPVSHLFLGPKGDLRASQRVDRTRA